MQFNPCFYFFNFTTKVKGVISHRDTSRMKLYVRNNGEDDRVRDLVRLSKKEGKEEGKKKYSRSLKSEGLDDTAVHYDLPHHRYLTNPNSCPGRNCGASYGLNDYRDFTKELTNLVPSPEADFLDAAMVLDYAANRAIMIGVFVPQIGMVGGILKGVYDYTSVKQNLKKQNNSEL